MLFVAVRVYVVFPVGFTTTEPVEVGKTLPIPWSMDTVEARFVIQESVTEAPDAMDEGKAVKDTMIGVELPDDEQVVPDGVMV